MDTNMLVTKKEFLKETGIIRSEFQKEASWVHEEFAKVHDNFQKEATWVREEFGEVRGELSSLRQEMRAMEDRLDKKFAHHVGILVEAFRDQVQAVSEYASSVEERLDRKIDTVHLELKQDINLTRLMVSSTRDELKYEIGELRSEVRALKRA